MRKRYFAIIALPFICGCGNADLESAVYRSRNGKVWCTKCESARAFYHDSHCKAEYREYRDCNYTDLYRLEPERCPKHKNYTVPKVASGTLSFELSSSCEACFDLSKYYTDAIGIDKVSARETSFKDVWDVKIYFTCPIHGKGCYENQYSYKDERLKLIK